MVVNFRSFYLTENLDFKNQKITFPRSDQIQPRTMTLSDLRTTYAVHLLKRTGDFKSLQKILGHQIHHVTLEAYSRYLKAPKRKLTL